MNTDIQYVLRALEKAPMGKKIDDYRVVVKCPICGEGSKQRTHGHCYIGLIENGPPLVYHCFINECSGIVTPSFLRDLDIYDGELESILIAFNRSKAGNYKSKKKYFIQKKKKDLKIPYIANTVKNKYKLLYLRNRIGLPFTFNDARNLKCIFSLKDFLEENKIKPNMKFVKVLATLNDNYIGFLDTNNDYIVFRNIYKDKNLRYVKYDIFGDNTDTSNIIYTIPKCNCNMFSDSVNLNICEGPFDAIGIFCNINKFEKENNIYAACCGSGYMNAIRYFIKFGFINNLNVNIYSDSDKPPEYYSKVINDLSPWVNSINIFYNELSKDYGVPADEIKIKRVYMQ